VSDDAGLLVEDATSGGDERRSTQSLGIHERVAVDDQKVGGEPRLKAAGAIGESTRIGRRVDRRRGR
jgi:hypothetical protein